MTDQEKREKAIEEMAHIMNEPCKDTCDKCAERILKCAEYNYCKSLYDKGYRKVDKDGVFHIDISEELTKDFFQNEMVKERKEAIKEFVQTVKRCLKNEPYLHVWLREIAYAKFGVEVEE